MKRTVLIAVTVLILGLLLSTAACAPELADDDYTQLTMDYITGDDTSEAARQAAECSEARELLRSALRGLGTTREEVAGASIETIKQAFKSTYPDAPDGLIDSQFDGCPSGGTFGARFYPASPLNDGTVIWNIEVSCSVHTPEAYARYLKQLGE